MSGSEPVSWVFWLLFNLFILGMLALDLGLFNRRSHVVSTKEALRWCGVWVSLALVFNVVIYFWQGGEIALQFFTGYLIEYSLSIDNIFVFILIFGYFQVPPRLHHKVLFWGILGALVLRATLIFTGVALIHAIHWIIYIFGAFLIYSGFKIYFHKAGDYNPEKNPALKLVRRMFPVTDGYRGSRFFVRLSRRTFATPLFIVLVVVETTDLVFALDSIPAILAISKNFFVVYTSNVFAILGLRSLYFAIAGIMGLFRYLQHGLAAVLIFIGIKMCIADLVEIPIGISLGVVATILALAIAASIFIPEKQAGRAG